MNERRIFNRFDASIPVKFLIIEENKEGLGEILDISAGGVGLVMTLDKIKPLSHLEMWLEISLNAEPFHTTGQVVWLREVKPGTYRIGVMFDKVDFMGMSKILRVKGLLRNKANE